MSEKRFKKGSNLSCVDTETGKSYWYACNLCGLLNRFNHTNNELQDELQYYKSKSASLEEELLSLRKRLERYEPPFSDEFLETVASINKISVEELKEIISISRKD